MITKGPEGRVSYDGTTGIMKIVVLAKRGDKIVENKTLYKVRNIHPHPKAATHAFSLTKARIIKRKAKMSKEAIDAKLSEEIIFDGEVYHVAQESFGPSCSCPHADFKGRLSESVCKHVAASRAAGLLPKE